MHKRFFNKITAVLALLALTAGWGGATVAAVPLSIRYEAFAAGLPVLTLDFRIDEAADAYDVAGDIRAAGLFWLISKYRLQTESRGAVAANEFRPETYDTASRSRRAEHRTHLDYEAGGTVRAQISPPEDPSLPRPSAREIAGSVDPLTALLRMSHMIARDGRCGASLAVYDGRRRYDLVFGDEGREKIPTSNGDADEGPALRCSVDMVKIAGFSHDRDYAPRTNHGRVWIGVPAAGVPPLPVRLDFASDWGWVSLRMVGVTAAK